MCEYFGAKYSHTFDRLPFSIFSVKLLASSVCACSVKCCLLFTVIRLLLCIITNERERHRTKFTLAAGAVLHVPHGICLATMFNWLRHRNEAPKSALHFGPGRYRLYWNRFHIGTSSRYPTLLIRACYCNVCTLHRQRESNFRLIKIMSKRAPVNPDLTSPMQRWRYSCRI